MRAALFARLWCSDIMASQIKGSGQTEKIKDISACLAAIEHSDPQLKAWVVVDTKAASQNPNGSLADIAVGIKDIIDVAGQPCRYGSAIYRDRIADKDAELVTALRAAGAVILGKTVTTEFAYLQKSITRNPHDLAHSPGGSSSGSAAAVAAGQIDMAIGTQTGGSVIRPASYCHVHALKPTRGTISREGVLQTSQTLDQVGLFARDIGGLAQLGAVVTGQPDLVHALNNYPETSPKLLYLTGLYGARVEGYVHSALDKIAQALPEHIDVLPAPDVEVNLFLEAHKTIYDYEICQNIGPLVAAHEKQMSEEMLAAIKRGEGIDEKDYHAALDAREQAIAFFDKLLAGYDGLLSASAPGEAPLFEQGTGDSVCNCLWSLTGYPSVSLPIAGVYQIQGPKGLGVGVQLTATTGRDAELLGLADWLETRLG